MEANIYFAHVDYSVNTTHYYKVGEAGVLHISTEYCVNFLSLERWSEIQKEEKLITVGQRTISLALSDAVKHFISF